MGFIGKMVNSKFGKAVKWGMLGTTLIGAAGVGQQAMHYQKSRDTNADVFEMVKTDVDNPTINKAEIEKKFEYNTDIEPGENTNQEAEVNWDAVKDLNIPGLDENGPIGTIEIPGVPGFDSSMSRTTPAPSESTTQQGQSLMGMEDAQVKVPADTLQRIITTLEEVPDAQENTNKALDEVDSALEKTIEDPRHIEGGILATVRVPLPTGDKPMLYMGVPNLFSSDFYNAPLDSDNWKTLNPTGTDLGSLQEEQLPLGISYDINVEAPDVNVQTRLVTPQNNPAPPSKDKPYILLAAMETSVTPEKESMGVSGDVNVNLDLDGSSTQEKIAGLQKIIKDGNSSTGQIRRASHQILQLQNRVNKASKLNGRLKQVGVRDSLENVMKDQTTKMDLQVNFQKGKPLGKATSYFWLGPDLDKDGRADIYITQDLDLSGFDNVEMGKINVQSPTVEEKGVEGRIARMGNKLVGQTIQTETKKAVKGMEDNLRQQIKGALKHTASSNIPNLENIVNGQLSKFLQNQGSYSTKVDEGAFKKDVNIRMTSLKVVEQDGKTYAVVGIDTDGKTDAQIKSDFTKQLEQSQAAVEAGQVMVSLDGQMVNQMLKDQKDGGSVNWSKIFEEAKAKGPIENIEFNKDNEGNIVYPRIITKDGKPVVNIDMTISLKGMGLVEGGTGLATGAAGLMDNGAKAITEGTLGQLGEGGKIAGKVIRSPFWLLNKVVGGAKTALDSTVGVVVDAIPKEVTGSKLNLNASIPLEFMTQNGDLQVTANSKGIVLDSSRFKSKMNVKDIIPTRLLVGGIAQMIATDSPGAAVDQSKPLAQETVSIKGQGIDFEGVKFQQGSKDKYGDMIPNIQVNLSPNENLQDVFSQLIGQGGK